MYRHVTGAIELTNLGKFKYTKNNKKTYQSSTVVINGVPSQNIKKLIWWTFDNFLSIDETAPILEKSKLQLIVSDIEMETVPLMIL